MADFNNRFSAVSNTTIKPDDESFLLRTLSHKAGEIRDTQYINQEFLPRIHSSFPNQGTPQGSHEGSQSDTPNKDNP